MRRASKYQTGNTVRLLSRFEREVDGQRVRFDPDTVSILFMNYKYEELQTVPIDTFGNRLDTGIYFYFYTLPLEETRIIYEWIGIYEGVEYRQRDSMVVKFF